MATATETESPTRVGVSYLAIYGSLTVLAAVAANGLVRVVALGVVAVPAGFWPLGWGPVIASTAIGAIGATLVYGVITRFSQRPNRAFTVVATIVLILSFVSFVAPPPVLADAPVSVLAVLAVMHVLVAVVSVGTLTQASKSIASSEAR